MDTSLDYLRKHSQDNWLLGYDLVQFISLTEALVREFANPNL
ncbi:MAG: hypothetical protein PUP92_37635 [Rhizonema sp. PD38]|nr:hypothetical protein [Rhizonema sp. PD38]